MLLRSLIHEGRFKEGREVEADAVKNGYKSADWQNQLFRLHLAERDWYAVQRVIGEVRKTDRLCACYMSALMNLDRGETDRAAAEIDVLRQELQKKKNDRVLEQRLWEAQGRLLCQQGSDAGCKLLQRCVDKLKNDYNSHAWGHGAYFMEQWGVGAMEAGDVLVSEEAFLEALAHDAGSVRGALGMQALCDRLGREEEAQNFGKIADRCWARADAKALANLRLEFAKLAQHLPVSLSAQRRDSYEPSIPSHRRSHCVHHVRPERW